MRGELKLGSGVEVPLHNECLMRRDSRLVGQHSTALAIVVASHIDSASSGTAAAELGGKKSRARQALSRHAFRLFALLLVAGTTLLLAAVIRVEDFAQRHWYVQLEMSDVCEDISDEMLLFALFVELSGFLICLPLYIYADVLDVLSAIFVSADLSSSHGVCRVKDGSLVSDGALVRTVLTGWLEWLL